MNNLDIAYQKILLDILDNGIEKIDRTGTGTISVFGRQIRHKMSEGFPLLTTKKMYWKGVVVELLWFLRGDTNIKFLVDNDCHIWDGDVYKNYDKLCTDTKWMDQVEKELNGEVYTMGRKYTKEQFINRIKTDDEFAKKWGDLGPIYGKQWRSWERYGYRGVQNGALDCGLISMEDYEKEMYFDQIANLINDLKTNPDSRRLMVSAWNVSSISEMVLPPCHYGFQVWTRELSEEERKEYGKQKNLFVVDDNNEIHWDAINIPKRAISLMWNQRSVDTFLGLPFNIASYGLLLEIIATAVNMVPDELIGNLGDTHLYLNHIDQAKLQISRELDLEERRAMVTQEMFNQIYNGGGPETLSHSECDQWNIPKVVTREPYPLPKLEINTEFWPTESGECGIGNLTNNIDFLIKNLQIEDFQIVGYQSHPAIKAPLSN